MAGISGSILDEKVYPMFAEWRLTLRKAEHALKLGQLEEAGQFVTAPDVRSHRAARELKGQVVAALSQRAAEKLRQGDSERAWEDLAQAEQLGSADKRVDEVRLELFERCQAEAMEYLNGGRPEAAGAYLRQLDERGVSSAETRRLNAAAVAWQSGRERARAGRFNHAVQFLEVAERLLPGCASLLICLKEAETGRKEITALEAVLHRSLIERDWNSVLGHANAILALASEHVSARAARRRAWQAVGSPVSNEAGRRRELAKHYRGPRDAEPTVITPPGSPLVQFATDQFVMATVPRPAGKRFLLWIDGVGGYLVCAGDRVSLGQPAGQHVDVPIMADLSRLHAWIERDGEGYRLRSVRRAVVNGQPVGERVVVADNARIILGQGVKLEFRQPMRRSATARLTLVSPHRLSLPADAIILMAESCVVGPRTASHVLAESWSQELVLFRQGTELWCRTAGDFEVDGQPCHERARLAYTSHVRGEGFSLALEPVVS